MDKILGYKRFKAIAVKRYGPATGNPTETPITYDAVAENGEPVSVSNMAPTVRIATNVEIVAAPIPSPCEIVVYNGVASLYDVKESVPFDLCDGEGGG